MALDYERAEEKESELLKELSLVLGSKNIASGDAEKISQLIISNAIKIRPPEKEEHYIELITLHPSGRGGGKSVKAGNILLNISGLMEAVANGSFAVVGSYQIPWLAPMAFIILWKSLWRNAEIEISENDAAIIWAMWVYRERETNEIAEDKLLEVVNSHLNKYERSALTQKDLNHSLNSLNNIQCIKRSSKRPENWWLREWVKPSFR